MIKNDYVVLEEDSTLSELISRLKTYEKHTALVFRKNKYLGIVEKKRILRSRIDVFEAKAGSFVQPTPILSENSSLIESAYLMVQSSTDFLPVDDGKQIIGVLSALDLLQKAVEMPEFARLKVSDFKLLKSVKIAPDDTVNNALEIMFNKNVDQIPVFEKGKLSGILTYKDLLRKYLNWSPRRDISTKFNKMASSRSAEVDIPQLGALPISSFSTNDNLISIEENGKLKDALELMASRNINDLIVMEKGDVKGLLTVRSILEKIGQQTAPIRYNIKFVGLSEIKTKPYQKENIKKISEDEALKIQKELNNDFMLVVHLKAYNKGGTRTKYSVHVKVEYPGKLITCSEDDYDVETALKQTFANVKNKLKTKFHGDVTRDKY